LRPPQNPSGSPLADNSFSYLDQWLSRSQKAHWTAFKCDLWTTILPPPLPPALFFTPLLLPLPIDFPINTVDVEEIDL
jgi:hypothetical protein